MGEACSMRDRNEKWIKLINRKTLSEDSFGEGILKCFLGDWNVRMYTGSFSGFFVNKAKNHLFPLKLFYWLSEQLLAS